MAVMTPERWRQIESLYHAALERADSERTAFLDQVCREDEALRREVDRLIDANAQAGSFLVSPAWELGSKSTVAAARTADRSVSLVGHRIGGYEILALLGTGGMGDVYRARDDKLQRDVALKVLPESFAFDQNRLALFRREARVLASLNHPNIGAIYELEEAPSTSSGQAAMYALVLELVEGPTLADRISEGPLPIDEALPIARQIGDALESAHEHGIIHRDLKPANIKLRPDGAVKVLDFGLAKALDLAPAVPSTAQMPAPPRLDATAAGALVGTAAYMSPEQARGKPVDRRADMWAFGCVLYEMLTGRRAFAGTGVAETLAAVTKGEPDWQALPVDTPASVHRLLRRCLAVDKKGRMADASMVRIETDEALIASHLDPSVALTPTRRRERIAWALVLALVATTSVVALMWMIRPEPSAPEVRLEITTPPSPDRTSLAVSPDGRAIAFVALFEGRSHLWLRALETGSSRVLARTNGAADPFWSPDSRSLGFFADGKLKRIDVGGGAVQVLANTPLARGGTWSRDGVILYAPTGNSGLFCVSATSVDTTTLQIPDRGAEPVVVTRLDTAHQSSHRFPQFLPDGRHFLYYVIGNSAESIGAYVGRLDGSDSRRVTASEAATVFAPSGYLLFVRQGALFAQRFDPARLVLIDDPILVTEHVAVDPRLVPALSASAAGPIVFRAGSMSGRRQFVWLDRAGKELGTVGDADSADPRDASLSPDGRRLALARTVSGNADLWLLDVNRGVLSRFTTHLAPDTWPHWSPDGRRVVFGSPRTEVNSARDLYWKSATGTEPEELLLTTPQYKEVTDWSPDGRILLYRSLDPQTNYDLWALPLDNARTPYPVVQTNFDERDGQFSPDGRWIAYQSDDTGRFEIYLQGFPEPGARSLVSRDGGAQVRWRRDGQELFYVGLDGRLMAVPIRRGRSGQTLEVGAPVPLFATHVGGAVQGMRGHYYTVAPDGDRFLMNTLADEANTPITVVLNWKPAR